ncbi:hypothetical protein [Allosphingosinicella humi]
MIRNGRQARGLGLALVGLALFMRLLVPPGWMPAADDGIRLILCGGFGAEVDHVALGHAPEPADHAVSDHTARADHSAGGHDRAPPGTAMDHPCAFAGFSAALAPVEFVKLVAPVPTAAIALAAFGEVAIGRGLAAPPPPSTGPPATF